MRDLPTSTKWLFGAIIFSLLSMGLFALTSTSKYSDAYSIKDLEYYKIEEPEKVLKKYKSFKTKEEADYYINVLIDKSATTLSKEEKKLFKDNLVLNMVQVLGTTYTETKMYINYNKFETSNEDFEVLKEYINNENSYDIGVFYNTLELSSDYSKFLYADLTSVRDNSQVDYDNVNLPKAFLVVDGKLVNEYKDYSEMELK